MAEPTPMPTVEPFRAEETYRPVSGLAIASFILALFFAVVVLAYAVLMGLVKRQPVLLLPWLFLIPSGAIVLALLSKRQITGSLGTRAGGLLANLGLWLGLLFGLGYLVYFLTIHFLIRSQAQSFLEDPQTGFFAILKTPGRVDAAYLLCLPSDMRDNSISDRDAQKMEQRYKQNLTRFRSDMMVRLLQQAGPDAEVEIRGASGSGYDEQGWWVSFDVLVKTPYETVPGSLAVRRKDNPGGDYEWFVDITRSGTSLAQGGMTALGQQVMNARMSSHKFAQDWLRQLTQGGPAETSKCLRELVLHPEDFLPGGKGVVFNRMEPAIETNLQRLFDRDSKERPEFAMVQFTCCEANPQGGGPPVSAYWKKDKQTGHIQFTHEFMFRFKHINEKGDPVRAAALGKLIVERVDSTLWKIDEAKKPTWKVVRIEITGGPSVSEGRQRGPG
jgi:hypothetical protein